MKCPVDTSALIGWSDEWSDRAVGPWSATTTCSGNVVFRDGVVVGLIDFDMTGPGLAGTALDASGAWPWTPVAHSARDAFSRGPRPSADDLRKRLDAAAKPEGKTPSQVIRKALEEHLAG